MSESGRGKYPWRIGRGADFGGVEKLLVIFVDGQDDDGDLWLAAPDHAGHLQAVEAGKVDVDQHEVGHQDVGLLDRRLAISNLTNNLDIRLRFEHPVDALPEEGMIVPDNQQAHAVQKR